MLPSLRRKSTAPGPIFELYLTESAKNISSARTRFLRSASIASTYAASPSSGGGIAAPARFCATGTGRVWSCVVPSPS